jgi:hypothetical protein
MAVVIEAPNETYSYDKNKQLFLAGGIQKCPQWQKEMIDLLKDVKNLSIYNPRRENFPIDDPDAAEEQITWEYNHLKNADMISFWFSKGSLNPIVLLELGKWGLSSEKPIFIGIDEGYEREQDVVIQTKLARPDIEIVYSLKGLVKQITEYVENEK